jgi:hypothetical protein
MAFACLLFSCTGSRKYFKAAEKLEKQGLVDDAAEYYLEALQRKATNVNAKIKLREVGQKHISHLASDFFRNYNTQQNEASLDTYERLKAFDSRTSALGVQLDYPRSYEEDYKKAVETFCLKNYNQAAMLVSQKRYFDAQPFIKKIEKYNPSYKNTGLLEIIATCEPLYQNAISSLESKNYSGALSLLSNIKVKSEDYKDTKDLIELASAQQSKSFILFEPRSSADPQEQEIQEYLYNSFSEAAQQNMSSIRIINNTPFQNAPGSTDLNNNTNVDLIQAIRKATGADYFYVFDVLNKKQMSTGPVKQPQRGWQEVNTRVNDTTVITEYKPLDFNLVKASRTYAFDLKYKVINAYTNQVVTSQTQNLKSTDNIEYNEFSKRFTGNINMLFPYNPQQVAPIARYSPKAWRNQFSARNELRSYDELKNEALRQATDLFSHSASNMR